MNLYDQIMSMRVAEGSAFEFEGDFKFIAGYYEARNDAAEKVSKHLSEQSKLLAAAPALYKALEAMVKFHERDGSAQKSTINAAKTALAAAK